jgi:hypothetical protein
MWVSNITRNEMRYLDCRAHVIPIFDDRFKYVPPTPEVKDNTPTFNVGSIYTLKGMECDDFSMPSKEYELLGVVNTLEGIKLDSLIMKQISGPKSTIFSLTRSDCAKLGVEFQKGLELFPKNLNWVQKVNEEQETPKVSGEVEFDPLNMSTYPCCHIDKTIRKFLIKISGFKRHGSMIVDPNGDVVTSDLFRIITKHTIGGNDLTGARIPQNVALSYNIVTQAVSHIEDNPIIDIFNNIYIEVDLTQNQSSFIPSWVERTEDGKLGVGNVFLRGEFHEHFRIAYTVNVPKYTNLDMFKKQPRLTPSEVDDILLNHRFLVEDSHTQLQNALQRLNITQNNLENTKKRLNETKMRLAERKRRLRIPSSDIDDFYTSDIDDFYV